MTFPLLPGPAAGLAFAVVIGFAFGFVLERAGLGRAPKLAAQFYGDDLTVFKVMFTAIVTAMLGLAVATAAGLADFVEIAGAATTETFLVPMMVGGFLLGVGFVLSGYCPGTCFVALASGKLDGLVTLVGVVLGQLLWAELQDRPGFSTFHEAGGLGELFLWELVRVPASLVPYVVAPAIAALAIGCFIGAEKLEQAVSNRIGWRTR